MFKGLLPTLLSLLLFALAEPAVAAPCASESATAQAPATAMATHSTHGESASGHEPAADCDSHNQCGQGCCPGLCAGALPATEIRSLSPHGAGRPGNYRTFDSSPAPENPLRPPIRR